METFRGWRNVLLLFTWEEHKAVIEHIAEIQSLAIPVKGSQLDGMMKNKGLKGTHITL